MLLIISYVVSKSSLLRHAVKRRFENYESSKDTKVSDAIMAIHTTDIDLKCAVVAPHSLIRARPTPNKRSTDRFLCLPFTYDDLFSNKGRKMAVVADSRIALLTVVFISLQAFTILGSIETITGIKENPVYVAAIGFVCLALLGPAALHTFRWARCNVTVEAVFFSVVAWSALVDLIMALSLVR